MTSVSASGVRRTYKGTNRKRLIWTVEFPNVGLDEFQLLEEMYHDVCQGPPYTFSYTDTDGITYPNVRWIDTELRATRVDPKTYAVTMQLELEDNISNVPQTV